MKRRNIMKRISLISTAALTTLVLAIPSVSMPAQEAGTPASVTSQSPAAAAARDTDLRKVMWVILGAWTGIAAYLFIIDRKVSRLERKDRDA